MPSGVELVRPNVPFLYKYSSSDFLDRLEPIILRHELYFPSPKQLNDPTEARPRLKVRSVQDLISFLVNDFLRRKGGESPKFLAHGVWEINDFVPRLGTTWTMASMEQALHLELETHRIYSMTTRPDNDHLWEKYAGDHTGYCLEFVRSGAPFAAAREVIYGDTVTLDISDPNDINAIFLFRKTMAWKDEEEVRILLFPRGQPPQVSFEPALLRRVILGKNMGREHRETIRGWALRRTPQQLLVDDEP